MLRNLNATVLSAWSAHGLAWAAGIWLAGGPSYRGVEATVGSETQREFTRTFLEVNGLIALWVPAVPILLTGVGLLAIRYTQKGDTIRKPLLWGLLLLLLGFCALGMLSFGLMYVPVALVFLVAAATDHATRS